MAPSRPTRRTVLATTVAASAVGIATSASNLVSGTAGATETADATGIRPFRINIPEEGLVDSGGHNAA